MSTATEERIAAVNGVELCWQGFGDPADPPLLLSLAVVPACSNASPPAAPFA